MLTKEQCREIAFEAQSYWEFNAPGTPRVLAHAIADALHAAMVEEAWRLPKELHFVCDGPPSHESGRFVELEDETGRSISLGDWKTRPDGLWELVIRLDRALAAQEKKEKSC